MADHGTCIHFNGVQHKLCKRGLLYTQFRDEQGRGLPCIKFMERSARGGTYLKPGEAAAERKPMPGFALATPCPFYEEPTEEQVQADRVTREAAVKRTIAAIEVAGKWRVKPMPESDRHEVVECPVCNGRLHLSQSSYNGHVHGKCETEGCVSWME